VRRTDLIWIQNRRFGERPGKNLRRHCFEGTRAENPSRKVACGTRNPQAERYLKPTDSRSSTGRVRNRRENQGGRHHVGGGLEKNGNDSQKDLQQKEITRTKKTSDTHCRGQGLSSPEACDLEEVLRGRMARI